jgi:hypothetical protein
MISKDSVVSGPVVAQPDRQHGAGQRGEQRRQDAGDGAVHHHAVADRLGPELVLADRLQHPPKGELTMRSRARNSTSRATNSR